MLVKGERSTTFKVASSHVQFQCNELLYLYHITALIDSYPEHPNMLGEKLNSNNINPYG